MQQNASSQMAENDGKAPGAFRTIREVAEELDVQQHVLRFWETKFTQVKPLTRGGGRRYYRPEDIAVLQKIHRLLYTEGYTIKGVQNLIRGMSKNQVAALKMRKPAVEQANTSYEETVSETRNDALSGMNPAQKRLLNATLSDLQELRSLLKKA